MYEYEHDTITLPNHPELRARIIGDNSPTEPEDDGAAPILRIESGVVQQTSMGTYVVPSEIKAALGQWSGEHDKFERYLRIFWGTTSVTWHEGYGWREPDYVCFDTAEWRESMGLTDEYMASLPDHNFSLANMNEWVAYVEGNVYFIVVERHGCKHEGCTDEDHHEWEEVDTLHGFYGDTEYLRDEAKRQLQDNVTERPTLIEGEPVEVYTKPEHTILVAITVHADTKGEAELALHSRLPKVEGVVSSWWIAEDKRQDRSDCDSAVFVTPGNQAAAYALLQAHGLTGTHNTTDEN